ncbi:helix-turn-helix domain-containing protein [Neobacillus cucumis]|nr:helix-turn-helix transcriptional regulator [Neobacillus cucumis]
MDLGEFIKTKRKEKRMSTRDLGEAVNTSAGYISNLENGKIKQPDDVKILDILQALNVDFNDKVFNEINWIDGNKLKEVQSDLKLIQTEQKNIRNKIMKELEFMEENELEGIYITINRYPEIFRLIYDLDVSLKSKEDIKSAIGFLDYKRFILSEKK